MSDQKVTKTFVRGSFLYLDDTGGYQERENLLESKEKVVEDKIGIYKYQQQLKQKVLEANSKRKQQGNKIVEKPVLIPIRDTPVEPVPQPILDNQKCERAMQEQFDYFQTYISQKQKEKKFQEEQERRIGEFLQRQKKLKQRQMQNPPSESTLIVMEKQEANLGQEKTKKILKMKIKKKNANENK